jgi:hypothetical protein
LSQESVVSTQRARTLNVGIRWILALACFVCSCGVNSQLIETEIEKTEASAARAEAAATRAQAANARAEEAAIRLQAAEARAENSLRSVNEAASMSASRAESIPIQYNVYDLLTKLGAERSGYGMYTYVLFGRNVGKDAPPVGNDILRRYRSLLKAISGSESTSEAGRHSDWSIPDFWMRPIFPVSHGRRLLFAAIRQGASTGSGERR